MMWKLRDRLGLKHPQASGGHSHCTCKNAPPVGTGRHFRVCTTGGGPTIVHDTLRDTVAAMHRHAGVTVMVEVPGIFPGTKARPADVLALDIGEQHRDVALDCAIIDSGTVVARNEAARCALATGIMARRREARKRTTRPGGMDTPTVEELLRLMNIDCTPFIYEVDGATTGTTANYIKKLSEIAKSRRGHDQQYFCAKWKTAIAMVLCKRGAQVAIRRGHTVNARRTTTHSAGHNYAGDGPLGSFGVEDPLVMGIEDSAAPKFADGAFY
jgi:hypothetical protein